MQGLNESFARLLKEIEALLQPSPVHVERWVFLDARRAETRTVVDAQASIELGYHQISERIRELEAYREAGARFQAEQSSPAPSISLESSANSTTSSITSCVHSPAFAASGLPSTYKKHCGSSSTS
jgi:hypothetical protein